ncbi:MAG: general secretion pathway protein I [Gammaproteobacteria bacterium]|jgi:general secretion pathway protein I
MKNFKAFTLLEVMVALVVISVTMGAIITSAGSSTAVASRLKEKTVANWVAQNQITLYRAKNIWTTSTLSQNGKVEMLDVEWHWRMKINKTDDPSLHKIEVEVYLVDDDVISSATGFVAKL